ncbi:MAG: adenosylcobinamide amidohydrolase, partial [Pseudomonadota bacterium]
MSSVRLDAPWLEFDLGCEMQVLSWAVHRPGWVQASRILWREVRNADLPPELDVAEWLGRQVRARQAEDAVTFLTSRAIDTYNMREAQIGEAHVMALATIGLSNAERIGARVDRRHKSWGTINIALRVCLGLTPAAMLEALSLAVEARTAAILDAEVGLPSGHATGTGTDCLAIAAPSGNVAYAGKHTDLGEAIGCAVYGAVRDGAE